MRGLGGERSREGWKCISLNLSGSPALQPDSLPVELPGKSYQEINLYKLILKWILGHPTCRIWIHQVSTTKASQMALGVKNPPANAGDARDLGLILGSGRFPGERNGNQLQYSCLKNSTDRGAWHDMELQKSDMTEHTLTYRTKHRNNQSHPVASKVRVVLKRVWPQEQDSDEAREAPSVHASVHAFRRPSISGMSPESTSLDLWWSLWACHHWQFQNNKVWQYCPSSSTAYINHSLDALNNLVDRVIQPTDVSQTLSSAILGLEV